MQREEERKVQTVPLGLETENKRWKSFDMLCLDVLSSSFFIHDLKFLSYYGSVLLLCTKMSSDPRPLLLWNSDSMCLLLADSSSMCLLLADSSSCVHDMFIWFLWVSAFWSRILEREKGNLFVMIDGYFFWLSFFSMRYSAFNAIYIWKVRILCCCRERTKMPLKGSGTKGLDLDQRKF